jgi:hypothetical protein
MNTHGHAWLRWICVLTDRRSRNLRSASTYAEMSRGSGSLSVVELLGVNEGSRTAEIAIVQGSRV